MTTDSITTENLTTDVPDGTALPLHVRRPAPPQTQKPTAVIVAHELFGVNPDIDGVLDGLAAAGHLAVAPEFYHRATAAGRWLPRDDQGRDEGFDLLHGLTREHALVDVEATMDWLTSQPGVRQVAMVGFSAGGHLAYLAACRLPVALTVVLYGGWLPTTDIPLSRPTATLSLTAGIAGRLVYLVGEADPLIPAHDRTAIERALREAHVRYELVAYPGVKHAFFWPGTPAFDEAARDDAWRRILTAVDDADGVRAGAAATRPAR